jgi:hypothetical protein
MLAFGQVAAALPVNIFLIFNYSPGNPEWGGMIQGYKKEFLNSSINFQRMEQGLIGLLPVGHICFRDIS